ncbi:hypothetical protein [Streptomyces sp. 1222.5]|uniref:hypothetical protein n=1 Tax=Streptomyces sp. 1222.5 TaxID=1881026 RepID=UPI003EBDFBD9
MSSPISLAALEPVLKRVLVDTVCMFQPGPQVLDETTGEYEPGRHVQRGAVVHKPDPVLLKVSSPWTAVDRNEKARRGS